MENNINQNNIVDDGTLQEEEIFTGEPEQPNLVNDDVEIKVDSELKPVSSDAADTDEIKYTNENATMTYDPRKPMPTDKEDTRPALGVVSLTTKELTDFVSQQKFKAAQGSLDPTYSSALRKGVDLLYNDTAMENALAHGKEWVQNIQYEGKTLHATVPSYKARPGEVVTGIKAVAQIQRALNQGSFLNFPCWSSGVWLTLRAPTTFELADYYDTVAEEIIDMGKQTGGAIYGNSSVYLAKNLIDLVEKLVHSCSIKDFATGKHQLSDVLVVDDLQTIAWALAVCMYPNGYPFEEPCTADVENCNHVHKTILNISKMHWVDKSRLTNWQIQFMSDKTIERSLDEIRKYQADAKWLNSTQVEGYPGFKVLLKTPTIGEHIDAGYRWVNDVENSIRNILPNIDNAKLNQLISERAGLTLLRSYGHYVKAFIYDNGTTVNSKADIDATINNMCSSPEIVVQFTDDVQKHIGEHSIAVVGIPRYKCPDCHGMVHPEEKAHPHLIPVDALQLFFDLRDQKIQLV